MLHPSEILRPKTKTPGREIPHGYFLITPGNSTLFFIDPKKSHLLFLQYPWKFHILDPPCLVFFYSSPINAIVKQVSASTYQHFCYQRWRFIPLKDEDLFLQKMKIYSKKKLYLNFMAPFYGWGSTASRLQPLQGGSLLFTTKFPEIPGTHFVDLRRMKGWVDLGANQWFWTRDPGLGIQRFNH